MFQSGKNNKNDQKAGSIFPAFFVILKKKCCGDVCDKKRCIFADFVFCLAELVILLLRCCGADLPTGACSYWEDFAIF